MEPIVGIMILMFRALKSGSIALVDFHDLRSAFQSLSVEKVAEVFQGSYTSEINNIFQKVFRDATFSISCENGQDVVFRLFDGIMAGGPLACPAYNFVTKLGLMDWFVHNSCSNDELLVQSIVAPFKYIFLGTCLFVDDIANVSISKTRDFDLLCRKRQETHTELDNCLKGSGQVRNTNKEHTIFVKPEGEGAHGLMRQACNKGFEKEARYLGPTIMDSSAFAAEKRNRLYTANRNWYHFYAFLLL